MGTYPSIFLKPGKEVPVKRFHPWIFSGAIDRANGKIKEGDIVEVFSSRGDYLATGHALSGSIALKLFSFKRLPIDQAFWKEKISLAYKYRERLGMTDPVKNEAFRLVYGEGDGLPGLIIDYYSGMAVIQCHSVGMHLAVKEIAIMLKEVMGERLKAIYEKSAEILSETVDYELIDNFLLGEAIAVDLVEDGLLYQLDLQGQKTGFFLDQRENRKVVEHYARGCRVLDVFCYSGGFSLHALRGGAAFVQAVDSSKKAIELVSANLKKNGFEESNFSTIAADAKQYLEGLQQGFDLIILDPPAFAKHQEMRSKAIKGYININLNALKKINPGGILFTFSCSQAIDRNTFQSSVMAAAIEAGRNVRIVQHLSQSPDHPAGLFHPEGAYLKGLVLYVE
ncbi:MAG: class I SAM-dependent rRNA methyltransferase [Bacteroidetes bacterium]|nr:class I SAM-dependent rRNA methyltransferase [Bacteroidota bacterium]